MIHDTDSGWEEDDGDRPLDDDFCPDCDGSGWSVECFDDICVGQGWCMHGDGDVSCQTCNAGLEKAIAPAAAPREWLEARAKEEAGSK